MNTLRACCCAGLPGRLWCGYGGYGFPLIQQFITDKCDAGCSAKTTVFSRWGGLTQPIGMVFYDPVDVTAAQVTACAESGVCPSFAGIWPRISTQGHSARLRPLTLDPLVLVSTCSIAIFPTAMASEGYCAQDVTDRTAPCLQCPGDPLGEVCRYWTVPRVYPFARCPMDSPSVVFGVGSSTAKFSFPISISADDWSNLSASALRTRLAPYGSSAAVRWDWSITPVVVALSGCPNFTIRTEGMGGSGAAGHLYSSLDWEFWLQCTAGTLKEGFTRDPYWCTPSWQGTRCNVGDNSDSRATVAFYPELGIYAVP